MLYEDTSPTWSGGSARVAGDPSLLRTGDVFGPSPAAAIGAGTAETVTTGLAVTADRPPISPSQLEAGDRDATLREAYQDTENDHRRTTRWALLTRALLDEEAVIHAFYSAGLTADAVGRGTTPTSRASILAGAGLIAGIDGAMKLFKPAAAQWNNWNAGGAIAPGALARGVLDSARFFFQIGSPAQTLASISDQSDTKLLRLVRDEARNAGYYAWAASAANFGSFGWSVLDRFSASHGSGAGALQRGLGALRDAIMDPADRTKLFDGVATLADGLGRWNQNPHAIIGATALQLGHYAVEEILQEWTRPGSPYERFALAFAKAAMYGAFTGTTARTWSSADPALSDASTLVVHRDGLNQSSRFSAVAALAAAAATVVKAGSVAWLDSTARSHQAVELATVAAAASLRTSGPNGPAQAILSPPAAVCQASNSPGMSGIAASAKRFSP
ncbi:hypothetical protein F8271_21765 [Micromonospora sp. ALFpr18c]|uniref:hypothetical protein n=1 Tax=unclassified Micromonospora TaxID=2617518 RepID=UPI00124B703C|nr:hypothetical protein [Micromonospora sp. ALFpr18c]KAB1935479.1 hypothetical protein F8271_21765 [Micromonospora sp. ALFpr18c]